MNASEHLLGPPADVPEILRGNWLNLPPDDAVARYLTENLWAQSTPPASWEVARLSRTAYIYRETATKWSIVAKFYTVKTGSSASKYAGREFRRNKRVREMGLAEGEVRAIEPLALWRGVLFLEHVDGLTLEDLIAVRRSLPGRLADGLNRAAGFLATLHGRPETTEARPDFASAASYTKGVVKQLAKYGVVEDQPLIREGLDRLIDLWAGRPEMDDFVPTRTHGDMTTTNFIFPEENQVVVIDWERSEVADPASDLGRLTAEVSHSINQHGGSMEEALPFVEHLMETYRRALPPDVDGDAVVARARFYRASSTLRIARNGWVPRLARTALVAQAMALLASGL
jgi:aminoglycoside phosphotransferase